MEEVSNPAANTHEDENEIEKENVEDVALEKPMKTYNFFQRHAMRMARWPKTYFWVAFVCSLVLSIAGFTFGDFSVAADNAGWQTRGTLIADRQTQTLLTRLSQQRLFYGGEAAWEDLLNNVQPGWQEEDDDDDDADNDARRRLGVKLEEEKLGLYDHGNILSGFRINPSSFLTRRLKEEQQKLGGELAGCDIDWYMDGRMVNDTRLWPIWKSKKSSSSVLDADVLRDICIAEQGTQRLLQEQQLCFGCSEESHCLPPYSIVLYARLMIPGGLSMDCTSLADAWLSNNFQQETEEDWDICVDDIQTQPVELSTMNFPESCGELFYPSLVDQFFGETTSTIQYTSSIFATSHEMVDDLYDNVGNFHKGTELVEGVYDTQYEDFGNIFSGDSVGSDMLLATFSAFITALAILIHTRSPFLTLVGLIQIILSFPVSYFVYTFFGQLNFFPFLNFIGVFVVFALGADHIFVAVDKWKNARLDNPTATTEQVAAVALPDAAGAMFLTTSTTAVAFFGTGICPVAPVKLFAIFCGLLIVFDYLMDILLIFPCLCIYDMNRQKKNCCMDCHFCQGNKHLDNNNENGEGQNVDTVDNEEEENDEKPSLIHRILSSYYQFLHSFRWPLMIASITALCVCIYYATTLQLPTSSDVRVLSEKIEFERAYLWRINLLLETLRKQGGSQAYVLWGTTPADTGDHNDPDSFSQLVLDNSFDPSTKPAQEYLRDFCPTLFGQNFADPITGDIYECPMNRFDHWLKNQSKSSNPDPPYVEYCSGSTGLPLSQKDFDPCIVAWSYQEGESSILSRDGKVKIIFFPFRSRVRYDSPNAVLDKEWKLIDNWFDEIQSTVAPSEVSKAFFSSESFWWYDTNTQMFKTAIGAAGIAIGASAAVILFSSRSLVMTIFSVISVAYVLTSVTSLMAAFGWTLGFLESICFAILIGVSVDFVIHFSHAYASLPGGISRGERTQFALIHMGPSILAAAITTLAGAIIMLFTVITFFQKFALVLFFTIIQALVGSFIVFLALTDCIGPSDPTYVVDMFLSKLWASLEIDDSIGSTDHVESTRVMETSEQAKKIDNNNNNVSEK